MFEHLAVDRRVQDLLFDVATCSWVVDSASPLPKLLFYTGPKRLGWAGMAVLPAPPPGPRRARPRRRPRPRPPPPPRAGFVLLLLAVIPAVVGLAKRYSAVPCPNETTLYCGVATYVSPLGPRPADPARRYACFPAAHASGGFALMGLYFLARSRRGRVAALVIGLAVGGATGGYQMLRGAHFLSHTMATMLLAWPLATALAWLSGVRRPPFDA